MLLTVLIQVVGGLALFLFGINLLSKGMERYAGARIQKLIESITNNRLKGFGVGMFSSALIQSSSMVMVSMIGMINAGLIGLNQGIGIILGFEIGTTLTAQLISFDVGHIFLLAVALGFFLNHLSKRLKSRYLGQLVLGLGILFMGMSLMKEAMIPLASNQTVLSMLSLFTKWPVLAVLAGLLLTALIQASAATVGIAIALGAAGAITLPAAIALGFGANIGTCVTGLLASLTGSRGARQAVTAQVLIATLGVVLFLPIIGPFASLMELTAATLPRQIANAHTFHNIIMSLLLLPFVNLIARAVRAIVPDSRQELALKAGHVGQKSTPTATLKRLHQDVLNLGRMSQEMLNLVVPTLLDPRAKNTEEVLRTIKKTEELVDKLRERIEQSLNSLSGPRMTRRLAEKRLAFQHNIKDIERVADLSVNLGEYAMELVDSKVKQDSGKRAALLKMTTLVSRAYATALEAIEKQSPALAREVLFIEDEVDELNDAEHKSHLRRLDRGVTEGRYTIIFANAMHDLERICDHAENIAQGILALREKGQFLPD